ncbi:MAG: hypothetical protein ACI9NC_004711 [Verrucomicrobiales bacterium]|jgi:hypothetical protein
MKWLIALLVSIGMFYTGYHHASRYQTEEVESSTPSEEKGTEAPTAEAQPKPIEFEPPEQAPAAAPMPEMVEAKPVKEEPVRVELDPTPSAPSPNDFKPIDFRTAEARDRPDSPELEQALTATLTSGDWNSYRDYLRRSLNPHTLAEARDARGLADILDGKRFARTHAQERFLTKFPTEAVQKSFRDQAFALWLLNNEDAMTAAYDQITEKDDPTAVVAFLADLYAETREDLETYTNLAIACALVHDSKKGGSAINRFFWYVKHDKDDRLFRDLKTMAIADLCLVVDGVDLNQMDWVQNEYRRKAPRSGTGKVYSDIEYRMDFVTGETDRKDVYEEYSLAEIKKHGGICSDQTHFATNVCRALGIPAVGLSGSGDRGAHAWVGYQNDDGIWTTHGRYENYANGSFRDPQTRKRVIESELLLRSEPEFRSSKRIESLQNDFRLIDQLTDADELERATELAQKLLVSNRAYVPGWERLFKIYGLRRDELTGDGPLTSEEVVASIKDYEIALKEFPDLLDRADKTLNTTLAGVLDQDTHLKLIKRRRHRVESIDEARLLAILELIRQEAKIYQKTADYDAITALYRRELRTGADDVQHFMKLAGDYWKYSAGNPDREKTALQLIGSRVKSNFGDKLKSSDWFTKDTAIKPHAQLAGFYRAAGDSDRALRLEKDLAKIREDMRAEKKS